MIIVKILSWTFNIPIYYIARYINSSTDHRYDGENGTQFYLYKKHKTADDFKKDII